MTGSAAGYYPDPALTHLPPTLTVLCNFKIAGSQGPPVSGGTGPAAGTKPMESAGGTGGTGGSGGSGATSSPPTTGSTTGTGGPNTGGAGTGTVVAPTVPPAASNFVPDYDLLSRCKTQIGVAGSYKSKQEFDDVVACYVKGAIAAGSTQSPAEIEQNIRRALAF